MQWLVDDQGADVRARNDDGEDALYIPSHAGHLAMVSFLMER